MLKVKIGGVPEHFNLPWYTAIENGLFANAGIDLQWTDYSTGTGAMTKDLRSNTLDIAVLLTEGIVADIVNGNECKIVQWYVKSPLIWGIHTPATSDFDITEIKNKRFAISRFGSGSHLMACVMAGQNGFKINESQFVIVNNMDGAIEAFKNGNADVFMWEKFMTKPLVDKNVFKRIGECLTPWSCFAIAVRTQFLKENEEEVNTILKIINSITSQFKNKIDWPELISVKYNIQIDDAKEWLKTVQWATDSNIEKFEIELVMETLLNINIIRKKIGVEQIVLN